MAEHHVGDVADVCNRFLDALLREKCPKDVYTRLWSSKVEDALKLRFDDSVREMERIMEDIRSYPITYNHYYTDTIKKRRRERKEKSAEHVPPPASASNLTSTPMYLGKASRGYSKEVSLDMEDHSCEEALDCLYSIYKVSGVVRSSWSILPY